ncbi:MAG: hypothetical protein RLZZ150_287, partial [Bacteroidota bacterium]
ALKIGADVVHVANLVLCEGAYDRYLITVNERD